MLGPYAHNRFSMLRFLSWPVLLAVLLPTCGPAQPRSDSIAFDPDEWLVDSARPKVLLVGTFHFNYPGLDDHKTEEQDQVDVLEASRQAEVQELLDYLARFRPNKIVVERRPGSTVNDTYHSYLAGEYELRRDEIGQLAFRLGERFGIDTLVIGDAFPLSNSLYYHPDSNVLRPMLDQIFAAEDTSTTELSRRYFELYAQEDKLKTDHTLLAIFKYLNSPHRTRRGHGHYLEFTADVDPDALAIWWYSRNLRIYRNIQRATTSPEDRILVLFGAGHLGILRQQFESSPAYELVEFGNL